MSLSILNNIASLNAQQNLNNTSNSLNTSLQRLSTGLKINTGADGPAAYVIGQEQSAQVAGLNTAIDNTNQAVTVVQTAEGALNTVSSLLTQIRGLALNSANSGVNDSTALAANQAQITNALATINNIANTTQFGSKHLLDGSAGVNPVIVGTNNSGIGQLSAGTGFLPAGVTNQTQSVSVGGAFGGTTNVGASVTGTPASGGSTFTTASTAATATPTFVAGDTATISGGGLTSPLTINLFADIGGSASTAAAVAADVQTQLNATAGAGAFTAAISGGKLAITSNISNTAITVAGSTSNAQAALGVVAAGETGAAGTSYLNITGGGLAGTLKVDLSAVTSSSAANGATNIVAAVQSALNTAAGSGTFTVSGDTTHALKITSNISGAAVNVAAGNAAVATFTGVTTAVETGTAGTPVAALTSGNVTTGVATGGRGAAAAKAGTGSLASSGSLTIAGGGLRASGVVVNLVAGDTAATVVQKVQSALDSSSSSGGGTGKFTVAGGPNNTLTIQSNVLGSQSITLTSDSAATAALTGVSTTGDQGVNGNAVVAFVGTNLATTSAGSSGLNNSLNYGGTNGLSFNVGVGTNGRATSGSTSVNVADNSLTFQIGANSNQTAVLSIANAQTASLATGVSGLSNPATTSLSAIDVTTAKGAQDAIKVVDAAISQIASLSGTLGAFQTNTLQANAANLNTTLSNTTAAQSVVQDTNFSAEIANFTRLQTQLSAGATVLSNANNTTQLIAKLLQG